MVHHGWLRDLQHEDREYKARLEQPRWRPPTYTQRIQTEQRFPTFLSNSTITLTTMTTTHDPSHDESPASIPALASSCPKPFQPAHVLTYNNNSIRVAKVDGAFVWHAHPETDELFYVLSGGPFNLEIANKETNDEKDGYGVVAMKPGDMYCIERHRRHRPNALGMTHVMVLDKVGTMNTGDAVDTEEGKKRTFVIDESRNYYEAGERK